MLKIIKAESTTILTYLFFNKSNKVDIPSADSIAKGRYINKRCLQPP
jgi:hypothetical protein